MAPRLGTLLPPPVRSGVDRLRTAAFVRLVEGPGRAYRDRFGMTVSGGPAAGLDFAGNEPEGSTDFVPKLAGTYELEIHDELRRWIDEGRDLIVDVGSAEGYWAVGLAVASRASRIVAFDIDRTARARTEALARRNGVEDRVAVRADSGHDALNALDGERVALLCDCEGFEADLLDPEKVPGLRTWDIVVELHEFAAPGVTRLIRERFATTHELRLIDMSDRRDVEVAGLESYGKRRRRHVLGERRPSGMQWLAMRPIPDAADAAAG